MGNRMLVISRKIGNQIIIGDNIAITVLKISGKQVRLGVTAPLDLPVHRLEVKPANDRSPDQS